MLASFCSIAFQKNKWGQNLVVERPIEDLVPLLASAGYDGIELWHPHIASHSDTQLTSLRQLLNHHNLRVPMVSAYYDFTTSHESANASLVHAQKVLAHAHTLGAAALRIFTGKTGSADATPDQWSRAVSSLQQLANTADPLNIRLACETHSRNLMDALDSSEKLIHLINRPNVGLILQPTTFKENWRQSVERLYPHTFHVHASNSKAGKGTALADGDLDWPWILRTLHAHNINCFVSIEWMGDEPEQLARHEAVWLKQNLPR